MEVQSTCGLQNRQGGNVSGRNGKWLKINAEGVEHGGEFIQLKV